MTESHPQFISPAELQIGMYIYLDIGWMEHPFPVNSFELRTQEQIQKLRELGLQKIRYAPEKSHITVGAGEASPAKNAHLEKPTTSESPEELAIKQRRALLHQQQASLMQSERQFGQVTQEFKHLTDIVHAQPLLARESATKLVQGMLEGILNEEESAIRLLSEKAGEKTALHSVNVTLISLLLGKVLELSKEDMLELGIGALLHDVGKMELPDRLRWLDEQSSPAERQLYQSHVAHGVNIARKLQLSPNALLLIAQHHEYADGSGYPGHISGEKMTVLSRIISLVNRFDNLCNPSNVAHAITPHEALSQLFTKSKTQSDTQTLTAFIKMMGIYPPGSVVQLSDERYALVVSVNSIRPIKPKVIIHDPAIPREEALVINLEHETQIGIRRSLKPIQLPKAAYDYLSPRKRLCYFFERATDPLSLASHMKESIAMIQRQWEALIEGMIEGVLLVDPLQLHIIAANRSAHKLLGAPAASLIGAPVVDLASSPEDMFFWEDVAAGLSNNIYSETLLKRSDDSIVHVVRRVSLVHLDMETALYVVAIRDHTDQRHVETELEKLIAELRATLESTADGILVTDLDGGIRSYNHLFAKLWNLPEELLTQRKDAAIYSWMDQCIVDASHYNERLAIIRRSPLLESNDILVLHSGKVLERVTLPQYARGRPIGRVYSFRDISQRLADHARIQLASKVFEASTDAIFITDHEQKIITTNPGFERLTQFTECDMKGLSIEQFLLNQGNAELIKTLQRELDLQGFWEGEIWNRRKDGHAYLCMISLVRVQDDDGKILHTIGFKDRTESYNAKQKIEELAFSDALTGLPNRLLLLEERINQSITHASRSNGEFALLFLDLDNFKQINDSLGHPFGDRVLIEVTERLKNCLRQVDTAARLGGDEFVLLLHQANASGAEICARRVLADLAAPFSLDGIQFSVTCSIGIALYPADGSKIEDLIKNADSAMYHVKERGRSDFRFYQRQMNIGLLSRMKIDHAMRQALEHQEFRLHYQPLLCLETNQVFGAEALIRWYDKDMGEVSPAKFIPIAEESGLIVAIGNWVIHTAIAQAAAWNKDGRHLSISVNVSALQFQQANFVDNLANALDDAHLDPSCIALELTESILIRDVEETLKKLNAIAKLGVKMSIDDFGTGYSSLSYLKRFPINKLKIDRSFVMNLTKDESDIAIVTAIISLAHALKLKVIAEGVETQEQKDLLCALNCNEIQGFLIAKALNPHDFEARFLQRDTALEQLEQSASSKQ